MEPRIEPQQGKAAMMLLTNGRSEVTVFKWVKDSSLTLYADDVVILLILYFLSIHLFLLLFIIPLNVF